MCLHSWRPLKADWGMDLLKETTILCKVGAVRCQAVRLHLSVAPYWLNASIPTIESTLCLKVSSQIMKDTYVTYHYTPLQLNFSLGIPSPSLKTAFSTSNREQRMPVLNPYVKRQTFAKFWSGFNINPPSSTFYLRAHISYHRHTKLALSLGASRYRKLSPSTQ
ncbi:hypothetical protein EV356DRAFT_135311 [Viridothelium virens]|uniref:Uncharacterized protein n=1 Tax=Viridothelium virens TaxID=1048519 RepID=A0A6A6HC46_VIRVR|nr:hypothetical protein EV356DRAFT_135311 [Viridothelium virens]